MGGPQAEALQKVFGDRICPITSTRASKYDAAILVKRLFQKGHIRIPDDDEFEDDLLSIKTAETPSGHITIDADRTKTDGHGDRFFALCYAVAMLFLPTSALSPEDITLGASRDPGMPTGMLPYSETIHDIVL